MIRKFTALIGLILLVAAAIYVLTNLGKTPTVAEPATPTPTATVQTAAADAAAAESGSLKQGKKTTVTKLLNALPVTDEKRDGYDRDLFNHWITTDGCDTREWVIIRQAEGGSVSDCKVNGGTWYSIYDDKTTTDPSSFDIDHRVPLAESWDSGAYKWSEQRREAFANDLSYKPSLIAVTAASNRSKSDQDPAEWMVPNSDNTCAYLRDWVAVKYRWGLSVDSAEKKAITDGLKDCPQQKVKVPPLATVK